MFNALYKKFKNQFSHNNLFENMKFNKMKQNIMLIQKKNTHNSIYIDIYNKQIQDVHMIPYFSYEKVMYFKTT